MRHTEQPPSFRRSQIINSPPTSTVLWLNRDQDVELALDVVRRNIPWATLLPFVSIAALVAWTGAGITEEDIDRYAKNYIEWGYKGDIHEDAKRRGVLVQYVEKTKTIKATKTKKGQVGMDGHYVFILFERGTEVPHVDADKRRRFNALRRRVTEQADSYALSKELYDRALIRGSNPARYQPSLAAEFLLVPEATNPEHVTREERGDEEETRRGGGGGGDEEGRRRRRRGEEEEETRRGGGGGDEEETRRGGGGGDEEETQRPGHHAPRNPPPQGPRALAFMGACGIKWDMN